MFGPTEILLILRILTQTVVLCNESGIHIYSDMGFSKVFRTRLSLLLLKSMGILSAILIEIDVISMVKVCENPTGDIASASGNRDQQHYMLLSLMKSWLQ